LFLSFGHFVCFVVVVFAATSTEEKGDRGEKWRKGLEQGGGVQRGGGLLLLLLLSSSSVVVVAQIGCKALDGVGCLASLDSLVVHLCVNGVSQEIIIFLKNSKI
jgi:hypothetical protein